MQKMHQPLLAEERELLFKQWCRHNSDCLRVLTDKALSLQRVSTKYLLEWLRYEGYKQLREPIKRIKYIDDSGVYRSYTISNNDTPLLARLLKAYYPKMQIQICKSRFDKE